MFRTLLTASLVLLVASAAYAQKGGDKNAQKALEKKEREAKIKALEEQIHQLHDAEKAGLKHLDDLYNHIIHNLEPKAVHQQLEEGVHILHHVHEILSVGDFDYGGNRHAAQGATKDAEKQLQAALKNNTPGERARAGKDLRAAHTEIKKALEYSIKKYGLGDGKEKGEPETRGQANRQLLESLGKIENVEHLLAAVDHEIKDYNQEKKDLIKQKDAKKKELREHIGAQVKQLQEEIKVLRKTP